MATKKTPSRKPAPKPASNPAKPASKPAKKPAKKADAKPALKPAAKMVTPVKKTGAESKPATPPKTSPAPAPASDNKNARKGITIVTPKPVMRKSAPKKVVIGVPPGVGGLMSGKGSSFRKPLIASGPHAAKSVPLGVHSADKHEEQAKPKAKSPYGKKELQAFRAILVRKRAELVGDVSTMETEALKGESGSLSNLPSHIAEQGSEAYDQSLALDLAAADRKLIKEIDDAIKRIDNGTYGICELSGKPIKAERLDELPWARYSIEAARELERRSMRS